MTKKAIVTHALALAIGAAMLLVTPMPAAAQHDHAAPNGLVRTVRHITEQYKDVAIAKSAGYALAFGLCVGTGDGSDGTALREHAARHRRRDRRQPPGDHPLRAGRQRSGATGSFVNWHANIRV